MNGTVKWYSKQKGFGFITLEDGSDVFCHWSGIIGDKFRYLNEGDNVVFDISSTPKGNAAINVVVENIQE